MQDEELPFPTARSIYEEERGRREFLSSGDPDIDFFLGGGIRFGAITEIAGEAGCGKSQFCMQLTAWSLLNGIRVLYIDTESGMDHKRIMQLVSAFQKCSDVKVDPDEINANLTYAKPGTLQEFRIQLEQCYSAVNQTKPDLLIVDSIAAPFREEELRETVDELDAAATTLSRLAAEQRMAVVCTNHVTSKIDDEGNTYLDPYLGFYWSHRPTTRIWMQRAEGRRFIRMAKCPWARKSTSEYCIKEKGICLLDADILRL